MKLNIILFLAIAVCSVIANCPIEDKLYSCKAKDEEGQDLSCTCRELTETGKFNCTCFADDPPTTPEVHYLDCLDALRKGQNKSGVYSLKPDNLSPFKAYCDMESCGGGWTVIQRRMDGSVDFYLNWTDYVHGFGNTSGEYWLGLSKLHRLTNGSISTHLLINMTDKNDIKGYAKYSTFYIGGSTTDYTLHISGYSGDVGEAFGYHNGRKFTTKDNDNDEWTGGNNAVRWSGAWWYHNSHHCNLNGRYNYSVHGNGINWGAWRGYGHSLPFVEMKIRRA